MKKTENDHVMILQTKCFRPYIKKQRRTLKLKMLLLWVQVLRLRRRVSARIRNNFFNPNMGSIKARRLKFEMGHIL
jgi:hypothetical protein